MPTRARRRERAQGRRGDMKAIGSALDFVGLNVYTPDYVRPDSSPLGYEVLSGRLPTRIWLRDGLHRPGSDLLGGPQVSDIWKPKNCTSPRWLFR